MFILEVFLYILIDFVLCIFISSFLFRLSVLNVEYLYVFCWEVSLFWVNVVFNGDICVIIIVWYILCNYCCSVYRCGLLLIVVNILYLICAFIILSEFKYLCVFSKLVFVIKCIFLLLILSIYKYIFDLILLILLRVFCVENKNIIYVVCTGDLVCIYLLGILNIIVCFCYVSVVGYFVFMLNLCLIYLLLVNMCCNN